jgi:DNA-binding GntR family transcriptional regulator
MSAVEHGSRPLSRQAYEKLRDEIVTLGRAPGEPLDEAMLVEELGLGRTPIREALQRLACEGLVTIRPRRGTFVAGLGISDLIELFEFRLEIEGYAAALAAERANAADIAALESALTPLRNARPTHDNAAHIEIDRAFHRALAHATHNKFLEHHLARLYNLNLRLWYLALDKIGPMRDAIEQHEAILNGIRARDAKCARAAMQKHIREFQMRIKAVI